MLFCSLSFGRFPVFVFGIEFVVVIGTGVEIAGFAVVVAIESVVIVGAVDLREFIVVVLLFSSTAIGTDVTGNLVVAESVVVTVVAVGEIV